MLPAFAANPLLEKINVADTTIDGDCATKLCAILKEKNYKLRLLMFRNSPLSDAGAMAISQLIAGHTSL